MSDRRCEECGAQLITHRADARFCDERCHARFNNKRRSTMDPADIRIAAASGGESTRSGDPHPLAAARATQEASKLNRDLGALIRAAIIRRLSEPPYRVHADDLEGDFPAEHVARCRKLAPAQFGGLAGAGDIREVERRKSTVPSRKGAKSSVYEFTISGRRKLLAGVSAGGPGNPPGGVTAVSADPGETSGAMAGEEDARVSGPVAPEAARLFEPEPERPLSAFTDVEAA